LNIDAIPTARAPTSSLGHPGRSLIKAPAVAGIAYATAWVLGLAVWPSNLDVAASNVKVRSGWPGPGSPSPGAHRSWGAA
jgi:hypothetical protein